MVYWSTCDGMSAVDVDRQPNHLLVSVGVQDLEANRARPLSSPN